MDGTVWVYNPSAAVPEAYGTKQYMDLNVKDAFAGQHTGGGSSIELDAEGMPEVDPDVIFLHFGIEFITEPVTSFCDENEETAGKNLIEYTRERYRNAPVLTDLTAV